MAVVFPNESLKVEFFSTSVPVSFLSEQLLHWLSRLKLLLQQSCRCIQQWVRLHVCLQYVWNTFQCRSIQWFFLVIDWLGIARYTAWGSIVVHQQLPFRHGQFCFLSTERSTTDWNKFEVFSCTFSVAAIDFATLHSCNPDDVLQVDYMYMKLQQSTAVFPERKTMLHPAFLDAPYLNTGYLIAFPSKNWISNRIIIFAKITKCVYCTQWGQLEVQFYAYTTWWFTKVLMVHTLHNLDKQIN